MLSPYTIFNVKNLLKDFLLFCMFPTPFITRKCCRIFRCCQYLFGDWSEIHFCYSYFQSFLFLFRVSVRDSCRYVSNCWNDDEHAKEETNVWSITKSVERTWIYKWKCRIRKKKERKKRKNGVDKNKESTRWNE